jgi:hypothetical protein
VQGCQLLGLEHGLMGAWGGAGDGCRGRWVVVVVVAAAGGGPHCGPRIEEGGGFAGGARR